MILKHQSENVADACGGMKINSPMRGVVMVMKYVHISNGTC